MNKLDLTFSVNSEFELDFSNEVTIMVYLLHKPTLSVHIDFVSETENHKVTLTPIGTGLDCYSQLYLANEAVTWFNDTFFG